MDQCAILIIAIIYQCFHINNLILCFYITYACYLYLMARVCVALLGLLLNDEEEKLVVLVCSLQTCQDAILLSEKLERISIFYTMDFIFIISSNDLRQCIIIKF